MLFSNASFICNVFIFNNVQYFCNCRKKANYVQVESGQFHTAVLRSDGSLGVWGTGHILGKPKGSIVKGNGSNQYVGETKEWVQMSVGNYHIIGIKKDGTMWGWGFNDISQLGTTSYNKFLYAPTQIGVNKKWKKVSTGYGHSLAIATDGTLWSWGANWAGQLGIGTKINKSTPTRVGNEKDWSEIYTGAHHSIGIKKDGSLWAWGYNYNGQLGNGSKKDLLKLTRIGRENDWVSVTAGSERSYGIKRDGSVWSWGMTRGIDGYFLEQLRPKQLGEGKDWAYVARTSSESNNSHIILVKKDGTLWGLGYNGNGQINLGKATEREFYFLTPISNF